MCADMHLRVLVQGVSVKSEDNFQELVLFLDKMVSGDQTLVTKFGGKSLYLLSQLMS